MSTTKVSQIRPALVDRKFLHSNSTSHEWMFGAIAELIDNAADPDVQASQFWIDVTKIGKQTCLVFTDNGFGMDTDTLHRMLSLGFSDKLDMKYANMLPIGRYGNGFKSGSMRLGRDAIVFTRRNNTMSVGLLSQNYLEKIDAKTVLVPMVSWNASTKFVLSSKFNQSLEHIKQYSLFTTEEQLLEQLHSIPCRRKTAQGTKIIIYDLARDETSKFELDFQTDKTDILLSSPHHEQKYGSTNKVGLYRTSLRKYLSILYLRPPMQIFLRTERVKAIYMKKFLTHQKMSTYAPKVITTLRPIKIHFGLNSDEDEYGMMMYNRNRLIQAFRKPTLSRKGIEDAALYQETRDILEQTIGMVELDCLTPNHIKQSFQDDAKFRTIESNIMQRLWNYCVQIAQEKRQLGKASAVDEKDTWVQCDEPECQKWRRLPFGTPKDSLPDKWYCRMNPDTERNRCSDPEEPEDEPEMQNITYIKQMKKGKRSTSTDATAASPASIQTPTTQGMPSLSPNHTAQGMATFPPPQTTEGMATFAAPQTTQGMATFPPPQATQGMGSSTQKAQRLPASRPTMEMISTPPPLSPDLQKLISALQSERTAQKRRSTSKNMPSKKSSRKSSNISNGKEEPEIVIIDDDDVSGNEMFTSASQTPTKNGVITIVKSEPSSYSAEVQKTEPLTFMQVCKPTCLPTPLTSKVKIEEDSSANHSNNANGNNVNSLNENNWGYVHDNVSHNATEQTAKMFASVGTSTIPFDSLPSVQSLKKEYEARIATLQSQNDNLKSEIVVLKDELEHERSRAYLCEIKLNTLQSAVSKNTDFYTDFHTDAHIDSHTDFHTEPECDFSFD